jgi:hypothetical protein
MFPSNEKLGGVGWIIPMAFSVSDAYAPVYRG